MVEPAAAPAVQEVAAVAPEAVEQPQAEAAAEPVQAAAPAEVPAAQPVRTAAYILPVQELQELASAAGLQWVNSDAEKVAAVQAAIAAEPKPVHIPRERPPVVILDEGPLVLVETRKDLSAMVLPFEQTPEHNA